MSSNSSNTNNGLASPRKRAKKSPTTDHKYKNAKPRKSKNTKQVGPVHDANLVKCPNTFSMTHPQSTFREWGGDKFVGARIAKPFGGKSKTWFYGTVDDYKYNKKTKEKLWHVVYDDGDQEDLDEQSFLYWLQQYNKLWREEMNSNSNLYQKHEAKVKGPKKKHYKVCWKVERSLAEFSYEAFDDCYGREVQETEEWYREREVTVPPTQWKDLLSSLEEANNLADDWKRVLVDQYIDEEDRGKIKQDNKDETMNSWKWSYKDYDEHRNHFLNEGYVRVEEVEYGK